MAEQSDNSKFYVYNSQSVVTEVLMVLEKHKIPISLLDQVLADIKDTVVNQPIISGTIGLSLQDYEENERRILQEIQKLKGRFPNETTD